MDIPNTASQKKPALAPDPAALEQEQALAEQNQALAVFHHAAEEVRFFKKQQWLVTNYTVLTYAALVAAPEAVGGSKDPTNSLYVFVNWLGIAGALWAFIAAIGVLGSLDGAHQKELERMDAVRKEKLHVVGDIHYRFPPMSWWRLWWPFGRRHEHGGQRAPEARCQAQRAEAARSKHPGKLVVLLAVVLLIGAVMVLVIDYSRVSPESGTVSAWVAAAQRFPHAA
jgi:hypothetical protein